MPQQFVTFLKNIVHGDLGISLQYRLPVSQLIMDRLWPTILLVGTSTILATVIGVYLGIRGAWNRGGLFDRISTGDVADALLDAGVVARPVADRRSGRRLLVHPRDLPDRGPPLAGRRPELAARRARHRLAPGVAGDDADAGLPRRLLPDHAQLAARRARGGLPADRAGQGSARRASCATTTPSATHCCRPPRSSPSTSGSWSRARSRSRPCSRSPASGCSRPTPSAFRTSGCCRARS